MMNKLKGLALSFICVGSSILSAQTTIKLELENANQIIPKEIYGQFAEHLGSCIYGGIWVGENSEIPNTNGYRNDVLEALKALNIPVLRWPGGCFADDYHWMDGIGPKENRPRMANSNWGGTVEDNSFGTHEFLNLCEMLGCEPYVSANVGSGTVEEMAKWVEYMTSNDDTPMANLRRQNGRQDAWKVKYFGVGNESWGCGGQMRPEYYADLYRRYAEYCRNFSGNKLYKVASGASDYDYNWTEVLMKNIGGRMDGLSLHYYTVTTWSGSKGSAIKFNEEDYYWTMGKCLGIEPVIQKHCEIMDKYDASKRVHLLVDEWGTWWDEEPGTIRGHLYQQNAMRDAMVAALSLNIFHKYTDRVKMANIAQVVNVLQAMILTNNESMVLTPTYHVFELYKAHQNATHIPLSINTSIKVPANDRNAEVPVVNATASKNTDGKVTISLANIDLKEPQKVSIDVGALKAKNIKGRILTTTTANDHNTFENPNQVKLSSFDKAKIKNNTLELTLPALSIVSLELN